MSKKVAKKGIVYKISRYIKSVRSELRKVTWPTRKEVITYTIIVIVLALILSLIMGVADIALQQLFFKWI